MFGLVGFGSDDSQVQVSNLLLEATNGWQNPINRFDADGGNSVPALDALVVINEIARQLFNPMSSAVNRFGM